MLPDTEYLEDLTDDLLSPLTGGQLALSHTMEPSPHARTRAHLERFVLQVHFQQRVSHQVPEAAAVEITVRLRVAPAVVDLRELQPAKLTKVVAMEILVLTEHLCTKSHAPVVHVGG